MKNRFTIATNRYVSLIVVFALLFVGVSVALAQQELIANGGFEQTGLPSLSGWTLIDGNATAVASPTHNSSVGSARLDTVGGLALLSQCVPWTGGNNWDFLTLGTYINADTNVQAARVDVYTHGVADCADVTQGTLSTDFVDGSVSGWQPLVAGGTSLPIPNGTLSLEIVLYVQDNGTDATALFDDVTTYPSGPNAVTLQNLDAKQPSGLPQIWLVLVALPLALGAVTLVLRRRRA